MRLLNARTLEFREFFHSQRPEYAILSHRWGDQEVTYKEMRKGTARPGPGLEKIKDFCRMACQRGWRWAWIDTCCIDKRSSAELSEAINSMYNWYAQAAECYVHLSDVEYSFSRHVSKQGDEVTWYPERRATLMDKFWKSSWFTRGWTLQELLAPDKEQVLFFDAKWVYVGDLPQLLDDVSKITSIDLRFFEKPMKEANPHSFYEFRKHFRGYRSASAAQKLSWVSRRHTSREEDMAYCLLGLFKVNMPLLYGEGGERAFYRLQLEILKTTDDESIFAWTSSQQSSGMIAKSPSFFANSADISQGLFVALGSRPPIAMTPKGLQIVIPKCDFHMHDQTDLETETDCMIYINCARQDTAVVKPACPLVIHGMRAIQGVVTRTRCYTLDAEVHSSDSARNWYQPHLFTNESENTCLYVADATLQLNGLITNMLHRLEEERALAVSKMNPRAEHGADDVQEHGLLSLAKASLTSPDMSEAIIRYAEDLAQIQESSDAH